MSYQTERDEFIVRASGEGLGLDVCRKLLRYASALQRLAVAQCNGDWPYNGDRDRPTSHKATPKDVRELWDKRYTVCPKCEASGVSKAAMRVSSELGKKRSEYPAERVKVCPDCRTQELVRALLADCAHDSKSMFPVQCTCTVSAVFGGDPRGAVLRLSTPKYPYDESGKNGAYGLYVPAMER